MGIAPSAESDTPKLLELIIMGARLLTNADGGSLYFLREGKFSFEIISNDSLDIQMGGSSGKKISDCLKIVGFMKTEGHIDPDIFEIFIKQSVCMDYAEEFLDQDQIDEIDEVSIPGCAASAWSGSFQVAGFGGVDTVPQYVRLNILFV